MWSLALVAQWHPGYPVSSHWSTTPFRSLGEHTSRPVELVFVSAQHFNMKGYPSLFQGGARKCAQPLVVCHGFLLHYGICWVRSDMMNFYLGGGFTAAAPTAYSPKTAESQATVISPFGCNNSTSVLNIPFHFPSVCHTVWRHTLHHLPQCFIEALSHLYSVKHSKLRSSFLWLHIKRKILVVSCFISHTFPWNSAEHTYNLGDLVVEINFMGLSAHYS